MRQFESDVHALKTGMFAGLLMKHGIQVTVEVDGDGDYIDTLTVWDAESGPFFVKVVP